MKFNRLTLAILLASSTTLLTSCGDDDKKPEAKSEAPAAVEQQKMNDAQLAEMVEKRYRNLASVSEKMALKSLSSNYSPWQDVKTVIENYTQTGTGATAEQTSTMTPKASFTLIKEPVIVTLKDTLTYNQKLLQKGIVAKIDHQFNQEAIAKLAGAALPPNAKPIVDEATRHTVATTDLLTDDNVKTTAKVTPFLIDIKEDEEVKGKVDFAGLEFISTFNEKTALEQFGVSDFQLTLEPVTFRPASDKGTVTLEKLDGHYSLSPEGDLSIKVSPFTVIVDDTAANETAIVNLDGIEQSGKGVIYDDSLGNYLGETAGKTGDLSFTKNGEKMTFGHITFGSKTNRNEKSNFDLSGDLGIHFNGEDMQKIAGLPVLLQELNMESSIKNFSPELSEIFNRMGLQLNQATDEEGKEAALLEALNAFVSNVTKNQTQLNGSFALTTDAGDAHLDFTLSPRAGEGNPIDWEEVISQMQDNPIALLTLLQESVDLTAHLKVKRDLVAAFGMAELVEMQGAGMIENEDGFFVVNIENDAEGLKVNGQPVL